MPQKNKIYRCKHGKLKAYCKDTECGGGTAYCKLHGKMKVYCKDPSCGGGSALCQLHRIQKIFCKDSRCKGGSWSCEHKVNKAFCKIAACGGGQAFCEHLIDKRKCYICGGSYVCTSCKRNQVNKRGSQCATCNPSTKTRGRYKEMIVATQLRLWADKKLIPEYTSWNKTIPTVDKVACGRVFPDFSYEFHNFVLILEVDEFQHKSSGYSKRCDLVRMQDLVNSYGNMPLFFIRYNPDRCKIAGTPTYPIAAEKHEILLNCMQNAISRKIWNDHITINYICYDCMECVSLDACPLVHTKTFATMLEFAQYIETTSPLVPFTP